VRNLSQDGQPAPRTEVILRAELDGEFVPVAASQTDELGRFRFTGVPADKDRTYQPGANLDGIHYPPAHGSCWARRDPQPRSRWRSARRWPNRIRS
jgi:hypothetical protein